MDQDLGNKTRGNSDQIITPMLSGLGNAPDLRQDSPVSTQGIKISNRTLSPLRTRSVATSPIRQTGSPDRREQIKQLEKRSLKRNLEASPEQRLAEGRAEVRPSASEFRPRTLTYTSEEVLAKSPKKARFADIEPDTTAISADAMPDRRVAESLERISNTLTATAVALRDVKETQKAMLEEIQYLRKTVERLEKKAARP